MARRLKVYRTVAGFHDAYVAAPSQKAALAAWGSEKDLFARGDAELVEDPDLTAAPLADPGTVIRLSRGTTAAQIAAMPDRSLPGPPADDDATPDDRGARRSDTDRGSPAPPAKPPSPKPKPTPKPSDDRVVAAKEALDAFHETQRTALRDLDRRAAQLALDRRTLERDHEAADAALRAALAAAEDRYAAAVRRWTAG